MKHHELKIDKCYADPKFFGKKPWEFRVNDRDFKVGDLVSYNVNEDPKHPVNDMIFQISYVLQVDEKHCIFTEKFVQSKYCDYLDGHKLSDAEKGVIRILRRCKVETMWNGPFVYQEGQKTLSTCNAGVLFKFELGSKASDFGDLADDVIAEAEERREKGEPSW